MFSIDWIAFSITGQHAQDLRHSVWLDEYGAMDKYDLVRAVAPWFAGDAWVSDDTGLFGYNRCMSTASGVRVMWHTERHEMGIHAVMPGTALAGKNTVDILNYVVVVEGKLTRLDVCFDDKGVNLTTVGEYADRYIDGDYVGRRRRYSQVTSDKGGHTLYIGARQSDRFMRIYNKAAEQEISGEWVRVELELKGDAAHGAGKWFSFYGTEIERGGWDLSGIITAFVSFPGSTAWEKMSKAPISFPASDKGAKGTRAWALGACGTQVKLMKMDRGFVVEWLEKLKEHGVYASVELIEGVDE